MSRWTFNVGFILTFATFLLGAATVIVTVYPDPDPDAKTFVEIIDEARGTTTKPRPVVGLFPVTQQSAEASPAEAQPSESPQALGSVYGQGSSGAPAVPDSGASSTDALVDEVARELPIAPVHRRTVNHSATPKSFALTRAITGGPEWGWHQAKAGDTYHPKVYAPNPYGWGPNFLPAEAGKFYFTHAGTLTHVVALPCDDARVDAAVSAGLANVYCDAGGFVVRFNADDETLTMLRVFSDGDRIMGEGR